jgi:hypothetical protein
VAGLQPDRQRAAVCQARSSPTRRNSAGRAHSPVVTRMQQLSFIFGSHESAQNKGFADDIPIARLILKAKLMFESIAVFIAVLSIGIFSAHALEAFGQFFGPR